MVLIGLLALLALVLVNAGFAAVEVALARVDPALLPAGSGRARRARAIVLARGAGRPTAQLGITICSVALGLLAVPLLADLLAAPGAAGGGPGPVPLWALVAAVVVAVLVQLVVGELVPKSVAASRPEAVLVALAAPYRALSVLIGPFASALSAVARRLARWSGIGAGTSSDVRSREELRRVVARSEREGAISAGDAELVDRALRLAGRTAADALTPRTAVQSLSADAHVGQLIDASVRTGLSRFPVHQRDLDDIVGVVHIKDVLGLDPRRRRSEPLRTLLRSVLAVPESKELDALLADLQAEAGQFAVVVDEYGGTAGIITLEDLIEELVGEIDDEHDPERSAASVRRWRGAHLMSGRVHVDEVAEACGLVLPEGGYETLGGFVMDRLGRIPRPGDRVEVEGWELQVSEMDRRRVRTVRVVAPPPGAVEGGAEA